MNERRYNGGIDHLRSAERLQRLEVPRVVELCLQGIAAQSVLDVGVGSGVFAQEFARHGLQVAGVDIDPQMVAFSKELQPIEFSISIISGEKCKFYFHFREEGN